MEEGRLEVLLVNAQGIKRRLLIGKRAYYVLIQCGDEVRRSKTTTGHHHKAFWNEKFEFKLPLSEWKSLVNLKMSIMDQEEYFKNGGFVGQSMIELCGIISEGEEKRIVELQPSPYSVVLEDDTYKGQIKVGLRFTLMNEAKRAKIGHENEVEVEEGTEQSIYESLVRLLNVQSWWRWRFNLIHGKN